VSTPDPENGCPSRISRARGKPDQQVFGTLALGRAERDDGGVADRRTVVRGGLDQRIDGMLGSDPPKMPRIASGTPRRGSATSGERASMVSPTAASLPASSWISRTVRASTRSMRSRFDTPSASALTWIGRRRTIGSSTARRCGRRVRCSSVRPERSVSGDRGKHCAGELPTGQRRHEDSSISTTRAVGYRSILPILPAPSAGFRLRLRVHV
jgi:hypothetical protein